jgi:3-methyladenine DNA glycosylase AlkC
MTSDSASEPATALKEIFDIARLAHISEQISTISPTFDASRFLALTSDGLAELSLMERLRRVTESLRVTLPENYREALEVMTALAPRLNSGFVTMVLPDYVALYGGEDFEASMEALKYFTTFGSAEFAIRHFLRRDLTRTLGVMEGWSLDGNEHVRRLASEGSRPRLPWSFRIEPLMSDPTPTRRILDNLRGDPSLYVRKSVANHLNDITKDNPGYALDLIEGWPLDAAPTAWIAKHGLRSLIKKGDKRALAVLGAGEAAEVVVEAFTVSPEAVRLGEQVTLALRLKSTSTREQRLVIDYAVHYVKKAGGTSAKVFKLKLLTLGAGESVSITRVQSIRDFTTRVHYAGRHEVDVMVNGAVLARAFFDLGAS